MTRQELINVVENIGQASADDYPFASEVLEALYCMLKAGREDLLCDHIRPFIDAEIQKRTPVNIAVKITPDWQTAEEPHDAKQLDKLLEEAWAQYKNRVYEIIAQARQERLIPYLQKTQREFQSGMGIFDIRKRGARGNATENEWDECQIPKRLSDFLETGIPGMDNSIGSLMDDYPEE